MLAAYHDVSVEMLPIKSLQVQFKLTTPKSVITQFQDSIRTATNRTDYYFKIVGSGDTTTTSKIQRILNIVFNVIIGLTMFLCFFALSANMSANLFQQMKEIGVLRSMGVTSIRIKLLYFYEAMVLVISSCTMGVLVGCFVAYVFGLQ